MLASKMMDEFTAKDKQAGSHEYNTVQQQGYSAHINININNRRLVSLVGRAPVAGFKPQPDQRCLCDDICKWLDFLVFSDKDEKP